MKAREAYELYKWYTKDEPQVKIERVDLFTDILYYTNEYCKLGRNDFIYSISDNLFATDKSYLTSEDVAPILRLGYRMEYYPLKLSNGTLMIGYKISWSHFKNNK